MASSLVPLLSVPLLHQLAPDVVLLLGWLVFLKASHVRSLSHVASSSVPLSVPLLDQLARDVALLLVLVLLVPHEPICAVRVSQGCAPPR
eukprot:362607-Chlamydomonas_euryale.AAC.3